MTFTTTCKFSVGDEAVFTATQERVKILRVEVTSTILGTYVRYGVSLMDTHFNSDGVFVTEGELNAPPSKFKVGDRVRFGDLYSKDLEGTIVGTPTPNFELYTILDRYSLREYYTGHELRLVETVVPVSPHYFQD
jgi:hypothetical protein